MFVPVMALSSGYWFQTAFKTMAWPDFGSLRRFVFDGDTPLYPIFSCIRSMRCPWLRRVKCRGWSPW